MKALLFFSFFQLIVLGALAQTERTVADIINQKEVKKFNYVLTTGLYDAVVINMQYGQAEVISNSDREALKKADIFQVDLVFSNFPVDFDMTELNTKRIKVVEGLRKEAVTNPEVEWNLIRQMRCTNEAEAKVLFHGIVIHYRKAQSVEVSAEDLSLMEKLLPSKGDVAKVESLGVACPDLTIDGKIVASNPSTEKLTVAPSEFTVGEAKKLKKSLPDSTVLKVLDRNSWKNGFRQRTTCSARAAPSRHGISGLRLISPSQREGQYCFRLACVCRRRPDITCRRNARFGWHAKP